MQSRMVRAITLACCVSLVGCTTLAPYPDQVHDLRQSGVEPSKQVTVHLKSGSDQSLLVATVEEDRLTGTDPSTKAQITIDGKDIQSIEVASAGKSMLLVGAVVLGVVALGYAWASAIAHSFATK